jgi:imidazolonepropionase
MLLVNATLGGMGATRPYGLIPRAAVALDGDRIVWAGPRPSCPRDLRA